MSLAVTYEIRNWEAGPHAHVVTASGELDLHAAPALRETLIQAAGGSERAFTIYTTLTEAVAAGRIG
jgi:anti-anti-sigma regulatory factor